MYKFASPNTSPQLVAGLYKLCAEQHDTRIRKLEDPFQTINA